MKSIDRTIIIVILLLILQFHPHYQQNYMYNLINYPMTVNNVPVNQVISQDTKSMHVFIGSKSFTYTTTSVTFTPNQFDSKTFLSNNPSSFIVRITSNLIVAACTSDHVVFIDETGAIISKYTSTFAFIPTRKCSFIEMVTNIYTIVYHTMLIGAEVVQWDIVRYDPLLKRFSLLQSNTQQQQFDYLEWLIMDGIDLAVCISRYQNSLSLKWNNIYTGIETFYPDYCQADSNPRFIKLNPRLYLFSKNANVITGYILQWDTITTKLITILSKPFVLPLIISSWNVIIVNESLILSVFLIVTCEGVQCTLQRFSFSYDVYGFPSTIVIPVTNSIDINTNISLSIHSNNMYSLILSQTTTNWLVFRFLQCLNFNSLQSGTVPFPLSSMFSLANYNILFLDNINYVTLTTGQVTATNTWYPFIDIIMVFPVQTVQVFHYSFKDQINVYNGCDVQMTICNQKCLKCTAYGDDLMMKCTQCQLSYYLSFRSDGNCLTKSECNALNGYVISNTMTCVKSCSANGYWLEPLTSSCVYSCGSIQYYEVPENHQCISACSLIGYYLDPSNIYCVKKCTTIGAYLDTMTNKCVSSCNAGSFLDSVTHSCVKSCYDIGLFLDSTTNLCVKSCSQINLFLDPQKNECISSCRTINQYANPQNNACIALCTDIGYILSPIDNTCITSCNNINYYYTPDKQSCIFQCVDINYHTLPDKRQCIKSCSDIGYFLDKNTNECLSQCKPLDVVNKITSECLTKVELDKALDSYIKNMDDNIIDLYLNYPTIINSEYAISIYNTSILSKTNTTQIVTNGSPYNIVPLSSVDLGQCEPYLKKHYNIDQSQPLIIAKSDTKSDNKWTNVVDFKVYSIKGELLNLSLCYENNHHIAITTPINANNNTNFTNAQKYSSRGINLFNSSEEFFNDFCYAFTSDHQTDIPLNKRVEDSYLDDSILCNSSCQYESINYTKQSVICSCLKGSSVGSYEDKKNNLTHALSSIWITSNIEVVKCYKLVFTQKNFCRNVGSLFMMILIMIELISALYFFTVGYKEIRNALKKIYPKRKKNEGELEIITMKREENKEACAQGNKEIPIVKENLLQSKETIPSQCPLNNVNTLQQKKISELVLSNNNSQDNFNHDVNNRNQLKIYNQFQRNFSKGNTVNFNHTPMQTKKMINIKREASTSIIEEEDCNDINELRSPKKYQSQKVEKAIDYLNEYESNPDMIIQFNRENFIFFYLTFLQHVHMLIRSFFAIDRHKTKGVTISMFFFNISLSFTLNALFFSEKYVSKSYETQGSLNFLYNAPKMLYSFLLSFLIKLLFNLLSSIASVITSLTQRNESNKRKVILYRLMWKLSMFYCVKVIFLALFWYYVASFCAVYPNIQMIWIVSSLSSCLLDLIVPFGIALGLTVVLLISIRYKITFLTKITNTFVVH